METYNSIISPWQNITKNTSPQYHVLSMLPVLKLDILFLVLLAFVQQANWSDLGTIRKKITRYASINACYKQQNEKTSSYFNQFWGNGSTVYSLSYVKSLVGLHNFYFNDRFYPKTAEVGWMGDGGGQFDFDPPPWFF